MELAMLASSTLIQVVFFMMLDFNRILCFGPLTHFSQAEHYERRGSHNAVWLRGQPFCFLCAITVRPGADDDGYDRRTVLVVWWLCALVFVYFVSVI